MFLPSQRLRVRPLVRAVLVGTGALPKSKSDGEEAMMIRMSVVSCGN